jgi:hypothetical protein
MSSADRVKYFFVEEATPGTTPNDAAMEALRITGESLKVNFQNDQSKELRADRTEPEQIIIGANVSGDMNIELLWDGHDAFLAAVCGQDDWTPGVTGTKTLTNGVAGKTYSVLKQFSDLSAINHLFKGLVVNTFNLNIQKKSIITGSFGLMGMTFANGAIGGLLSGTPTFALASTTDPMNGSSHITDIKMNGSTMTAAIDKESISITNNYKPIEQLGQLSPTGHTQGRIVVTGTMDIYFKTEVEFNMYKSGTAFSHEIEFTDNDGNQLLMLFDRCKFEDMEVVAGGTNQDIIAKGKWRALYDSANNRVFQLTSIAA